MKQKYDITGMTCSACSAHVDKSVRMIRGVGEVNVNLLKNSMVVEYDESLTNDDAIIAAVVSGGYGAAVAAGVVVVRLLSATVIGIALVKVITAALKKTGVLKGFACAK